MLGGHAGHALRHPRLASMRRRRARAAAQGRRLPARRADPGRPPAGAAAALRGADGAGLVLADGTQVVGSRPIMRALEARAPEPPLLPADEAARARVERAEEWGDEVLQPLARRLVWAALRRDAGARSCRYTEGARLPVPRPLARCSAPLTARPRSSQPRRRRPRARGPGGLERHLERIEGWIADGVLGGRSRTPRTCRSAPALALLGTFDDLAPQLSRPAGHGARARAGSRATRGTRRRARCRRRGFSRRAAAARRAARSRRSRERGEGVGRTAPAAREPQLRLELEQRDEHEAPRRRPRRAGATAARSGSVRRPAAARRRRSAAARGGRRRRPGPARARPPCRRRAAASGSSSVSIRSRR